MGWRGFRQLIVPFAEEEPRAEVDFVVFLFLDPQLAAMDAYSQWLTVWWLRWTLILSFRSAGLKAV